MELLDETRSECGLRRGLSVARSGVGTARRVWLTVAAMLIAAVALGSQQRPNFSGAWMVDGLPPTVTGKGNSPESQLHVGTSVTHLVIRQDTKVVEVIEENASGGPNTLVYHLDGSAATNPFRLILDKVRVLPGDRLMAVEERIPAEYTTKWKDGQLVSAITVQVPGEKEPRHYEETISLGAGGVLSVRIQRVGTGDSRTLYLQEAVRPLRRHGEVLGTSMRHFQVER